MMLQAWIASLSLLAAFASSPSELDRYFQEAARTADVPEALLRAVSYVETRGTSVAPDQHSHVGHMKVYGIMGLKEDAYFSNTLGQAVRLTQKSRAAVITDDRTNILGAALTLRNHFNKKVTAAQRADEARAATLEAKLPYWKSAVIALSGIPTTSEAQDYFSQIERTLWKGAQARAVQVPKSIFLTDPVEPMRSASTARSEFPEAEWDPSPNFDAGMNAPKFIVVHSTQGNFSGASSWLKNKRSKVSAHYILRSEDGYTKQLVRENDQAWHVRCWNPVTIGIETESFVDTPEYFTSPLYSKLSRLILYLSKKYSIPATRQHLIGHDAWNTPDFLGSPISEYGDCNDHSDPGIYFDWLYLLELMNLGKKAPVFR